MFWILCIISLVFSGCSQEPQVRNYTEVVTQEPVLDPHAGMDMVPMMGEAASSENPFTWVLPKGWAEEAGNGMRMASFYLSTDKEAIDCSIVSLGGMAGGLEANLRRWMGQIGLDSTPIELADLINAASSIKIKSGQEAKVFDFTTIQSKAKAEDKSMVVVMLSIDSATVFVKMTGSIDAVKKNKADFYQLVSSLNHGTNP